MRIANIQYQKQVSPDVLNTELKSSSIASLIDSFDYEHDLSKLIIYTNTVLEPSQRSMLDAIIADHDGTSIAPESRPTTNVPTYQSAVSASTGSVAITSGYTDLLALIPSVPDGRYKVSVTMQYAASSTSSDFKIGARVDNALVPSTESVQRVPRSGTSYRYKYVDIFECVVVSGVTKIAICGHSPSSTLYYYNRSILLERLS